MSCISPKLGQGGLELHTTQGSPYVSCQCIFTICVHERNVVARSFSNWCHLGLNQTAGKKSLAREDDLFLNLLLQRIVTTWLCYIAYNAFYWYCHTENYRNIHLQLANPVPEQRAF